jgi:hypothetical protein
MGSELMCESGDWRLWDGGVKKYTQTLNIRKRSFLYNAAFQPSPIVLELVLVFTSKWMALIKTELASVGLNYGYSHQLTDHTLPSITKQLKLSTSPSPAPKQFPFSSSISKPITKTTPSLAPQLAHTVCCTPQSR